MGVARMPTSCLLGLALLALVAGCQRPATLHPVNGKVTYKGAVVNNGVVVFTPDPSRGESGPVALGTIKEDGSYVLSTGETSGASPGWYRVSVAAFTGPAPKNQSPDKFQAPLPLLPEKYRDPELSMLRCRVQPNQVNTINLELD
jgi:hypothetical protein